MSGIAEKFGGGTWERGPACGLPAHYLELQALCDALGHAAQQEMAEAIERGDAVSRERAYGKWLGVRGILRQHSQDVGYLHRVMLRMPAIVVRHHRHGNVADFGLARELGFLQVRHADDVHAPGTVDVRFRFRREGRAFHAQVRAAAFSIHSGR